MIYLDNHATTQPSPRVVAAVCRAMQCCGNAASAHPLGKAMSAQVERARQQVAYVVGVRPSGVIFTSGATEANNLALRGVVDACARDRNGRNRVVVSAVEHSSVLATARSLADAGRAVVTVLPTDATGAVDPAVLSRALGPDVAIVSIMHANNEIGAINPIDAIAALCKARGIPFHVDACQSFAKIPLRASQAQFISASAHKLRGPTGVGALIVTDEGLRRWIVPQQTGGTQEDGLRAGTTNAHGIIGFGEAAEETSAAWRAGEGARLASLRGLLFMLLRENLGDEWVRLNGPADPAKRLPQNLNVTFVGVCPMSLDEAVRDRVCVSGAAACRALGGERSHVLEAIGSPDDGATVRFGLGQNDEAQVREIAALFVTAARRLRGQGCAIPKRA
jgi:cysteine desulfurase